MEIVYKINQMEESVKFCSNQYDEFHKTKGSLIQRLDKLEKEKNKLETKLFKKELSFIPWCKRGEL